MMRKLALANLSDLDPPRVVYLTLFSHPTPPERIVAARLFPMPGADRQAAVEPSGSAPGRGTRRRR
jgi:STE24 endopeptidase